MEVEHLRRLSAQRLAMPRLVLTKSDHSTTLIRSATVLLSSHIQGYIEDLVDYVLEHMVSDLVPAAALPDRLRYHVLRFEIEIINKSQDGAKVIETVRNIARNHNAIISVDGHTPAELLSLPYKDGFGNPTVQEIKGFLKRFGFDGYEGEMKRRLKGDWPIVENAVNQTIDRRNKIAHGDSQATLTPTELKDYGLLVRKFCSMTDSVTQKHFRKMGCKF